MNDDEMKLWMVLECYECQLAFCKVLLYNGFRNSLVFFLMAGLTISKEGTDSTNISIDLFAKEIPSYLTIK